MTKVFPWKIINIPPTEPQQHHILPNWTPQGYSNYSPHRKFTYSFERMRRGIRKSDSFSGGNYSLTDLIAASLKPKTIFRYFDQSLSLLMIRTIADPSQSVCDLNPPRVFCISCIFSCYYQSLAKSKMSSTWTI